MYVCLCKAVTQQQIHDAVDQGHSYAQVRQNLGVATDCGCCGQAAKQVIRERVQQLPECEFSAAS
ncbi:(2Fe-2S)-binding protein [Bacterioplanes sanyensis]|uniref:Bacterioferritin-associated ferredoxin n=1 Tax=Bacterioplanes sanyensis TaxID=1249553 RepID=A0A222FPA6_9GAMM|nr:(2Fe-2S)-binding protein [Bacterioplanes sanyensis]ASP40609.1 (2Fe-2S)-binding protein [Bacterioplanes sanyensis]